MMEYTDSYYNLPLSLLKRGLGNCDKINRSDYDRLPGCNESGYYYVGQPPKGSDTHFDHKEDFAEAVTAYFHKSEAETQVSRYENIAIYTDLLYYEDYSKTKRYQFVKQLLSDADKMVP